MFRKSQMEFSTLLDMGYFQSGSRSIDSRDALSFGMAPLIELQPLLLTLLTLQEKLALTEEKFVCFPLKNRMLTKCSNEIKNNLTYR